MTPLSWLERRLGRTRMPNLVFYICTMQCIVFVLCLGRPEMRNLFVLNPYAVQQGEWWRLISFAFYPFSTDILFFPFVMYFMFMMINGLEGAWGTFRLNVFYLLGLAGHIAAAMLFGVSITPFYLQTTLFLAFAQFYPDMMLYLFFILPVKVIWLAWLDGALLIWELATGSWDARCMIILSMVNFLLFFGRDFWQNFRTQRHVFKRRSAFAQGLRIVEAMPAKKCMECGKGIIDNADLRLCTCRKCGDEGKFWCFEHVKKHLNLS